MKTRGLEISEAVGDDAPPKSIDCPLSENKHQVLKPQSSKDSISSNKLVCDNDLPPSTPAAPSLNVPIVTHASKGGGVQQLYDERNTSITTRVSECLCNLIEPSGSSSCVLSKFTFVNPKHGITLSKHCWLKVSSITFL